MKYVISLMEDTGSREDWQPKLQIPINLPEPFPGWREERAFERAVQKQLKELGIMHPYGNFHVRVTEAVPEIVSATPADVAAAIAAEYPRLASIWSWDQE